MQRGLPPFRQQPQPGCTLLPDATETLGVRPYYLSHKMNTARSPQPCPHLPIHLQAPAINPATDQPEQAIMMGGRSKLIWVP